MIDRIKKYIKDNNMIQKGDKVACGVSAGPDSVCLFYCLYMLREELGFEVFVVHVNHGIRGEEAKRDENFVRDLAAEHGVPFGVYSYEVPEIAASEGITVEEAGRNARKAAFADFMKIHGCNKIALAHNANDVAETVILNLCRGTGITGMGGIAPVHENIIRPLLFAMRHDIEEFLADNNISCLTDSTNNEDEYTRNKIRHHVLPYLEKEINPKAVRHISDAAELAREAAAFMEKESEEAAKHCLSKTEEGVLIRNEAFAGNNSVPASYVIRKGLFMITPHLKDITAEHVAMIEALYGLQTGKRASLPYGITAERTYGGVALLGGKSGKSNKSIIKNADMKNIQDKAINTAGHTKAFGYDIYCEVTDKVPENIPEKAYTKWFDYDKIKGVLCIRRRKCGDRIAINDEGGTKKLSDYMIDEKIPRHLRDEIPVMADEEKILWIVGKRLAADVKVTCETRRVLMIRLDKY